MSSLCINSYYGTFHQNATINWYHWESGKNVTINRYQLRRVAIGCGNSTTVEFEYLSLTLSDGKKTQQSTETKGRIKGKRVRINKQINWLINVWNNKLKFYEFTVSLLTIFCIIHIIKDNKEIQNLHNNILADCQKCSKINWHR